MMKYTIPAVVALAAVALARPVPTPAGGYYYPPPVVPGSPYPYPGTGTGNPYPYSGSGIGNPYPQDPYHEDSYPDGVIVCNCKNSSTKESFISPMCKAAGGVEMYLLTEENAPRQHLVRWNAEMKIKKGGILTSYVVRNEHKTHRRFHGCQLREG